MFLTPKSLIKILLNELPCSVTELKASWPLYLIITPPFYNLLVSLCVPSFCWIIASHSPKLPPLCGVKLNLVHYYLTLVCIDCSHICHTYFIRYFRGFGPEIVPDNLTNWNLVNHRWKIILKHKISTNFLYNECVKIIPRSMNQKGSQITTKRSTYQFTKETINKSPCLNYTTHSDGHWQDAILNSD